MSMHPIFQQITDDFLGIPEKLKTAASVSGNEATPDYAGNHRHHELEQVSDGMRNASKVMRDATARIHELETALNRMVHTFENTRDDSEGHYPALDSGCIQCTQGATPNRYNTGPCAYHNAKKLLGHAS